MAKKALEPIDPLTQPLPGTRVAAVIDTGMAPADSPDPFAHVGDEHWGSGGRYIVDGNGKRVPAPADPATPVTTEPEAQNG